jgi:hypothetical protein
MNISRHQLVGFGSTKTMATELTKKLKPTGKEKRSNLYSITDVIRSIQAKLGTPRIRKTTKAVLGDLVTSLQELPTNVIAIPFGAPKTETSEAVHHLLKSATSSKTTKHKMKAAELKGKRLSHVQ